MVVFFIMIKREDKENKWKNYTIFLIFSFFWLSLKLGTKSNQQWVPPQIAIRSDWIEKSETQLKIMHKLQYKLNGQKIVFWH